MAARLLDDAGRLLGHAQVCGGASDLGGVEREEAPARVRAGRLVAVERSGQGPSSEVLVTRSVTIPPRFLWVWVLTPLTALWLDNDMTTTNTTTQTDRIAKVAEWTRRELEDAEREIARVLAQMQRFVTDATAALDEKCSLPSGYDVARFGEKLATAEQARTHAAQLLSKLEFIAAEEA